MPNLLICVEGSASDEDAVACRAMFTELALDRWTYRPELVDQIDAVPSNAPDHMPALRTVGVVVALPDPEDAVDENAVGEDVSRLVSAMSNLARRARIEFVIEYREEAVGFLDGTAPDARFLDEFFGR